VLDDGVQNLLVAGTGAELLRYEMAGCGRSFSVFSFVHVSIYDIRYPIAPQGPATVARVEFGERLALLRRQAGLTQVSLAERAGVHVTQLRRYEAGTTEPTLGALRRLAVALSVSADALVFGDEPRLPADEAMRLLFEATVFLDETEQAHVRALLEAFLARHEASRSEEGARKPRQRGH
jgi:transcriptional regulator with XRE-family HTH domain